MLVFVSREEDVFQTIKRYLKKLQLPLPITARIFYLNQAFRIEFLNTLSKVKLINEVLSSKGFLSQVKFVNSMNWDWLIVLDACRYDYFEYGL